MAKKWTGHNLYPEKLRNPDLLFETYLLCSHISGNLKRLAPKCRGRLLDVGAGHAPYKEFFTPYVKKYETLDFFKFPNVNADHISSIYKMPFKDNTFDVLLCTQVLEHLENPKAAIEEMRRVLKKNGKLILSTHMAMVLHSEPYDYYRFTKYGLKLLFKNFKNTKIITNGGMICFVCQLMSWAFFYKIPSPFDKPFILLFNLFGKYFDNLLYSDYITLNYFVIAKK